MGQGKNKCYSFEELKNFLDITNNLKEESESERWFQYSKLQNREWIQRQKSQLIKRNQQPQFTSNSNYKHSYVISENCKSRRRPHQYRYTSLCALSAKLGHIHSLIHNQQTWPKLFNSFYIFLIFLITKLPFTFIYILFRAHIVSSTLVKGVQYTHPCLCNNLF